ncbi:MAG TPA: TonB-dependent receptor [Caulobacteraceae bacterium]|nr:TonB-dependent receptor [Caulobacteraceae bacterium]
MATLAASGAYAQSGGASQGAGAVASSDQVVVTGTRIRAPNQTSISPIQTMVAADIAAGGRPQSIDILTQLPQVTELASVDIGPTSDALSGPGGVATVDLRGLGPTRTLVLVNGRRLGVGDPNTGNPNPAPDINQIPSQLIDRVDVLTGGASSTYGSDAVGGVVNFIMKQNFQGLQLDAQAGGYEHGQQNSMIQGLERGVGVAIPGTTLDGGSQNISLVFGTNTPDRKGNFTGYITYSKQDPVKQGARDYSACQLVTTGTPTPACSGSSNSNIFYAADGSSDYFAVSGKDFVHNPDFDDGFVYSGQPATTPPVIFNANPYEYLIQENERHTAGYFANYKVNDNLEFYSELGYMQSVSNVNVGPSALFQGEGVTASGGFLVNCNNPYLSASEQTGLECSAADIASGAEKDIYIGRRNIEGGPRDSYYDHDNWRLVGGVRGDIVGSWKYDLYASYYSTTLTDRSENYLSLSAVQAGLLIGGTAANPVCLTATTCTPYDIFQEGGVTSAQAQSLVEEAGSTGTTTERIVEGDFTGNLGDYGVKSPWAMNGVQVALGATDRVDTLVFQPDAAELSGDLSGFGGASVPINKSIEVTEGYGELHVPILDDMPFAKSFSLDMGYRYSGYSTGAVAHTFKGGGEWAPIDDFKIRGSYNRAIRAPDLLSLYTPQFSTNTSEITSDPCAGPTPSASLALCERTGVTAAQYGNIPQCAAQQCAVLDGGNPKLNPEQADTYSIGFIAKPRYAPGLTASLDYYHIDTYGLIGTIDASTSFNNCLNTGDPIYCANVKRNASNGNIFTTSPGVVGYIVTTNVNAGAALDSGLDAQLNYNVPLADWGMDYVGKLAFQFDGSYTLKSTVTPLPGAQTYDCNGLFGSVCQGIFPKWRHTARLNWTMPWAPATVSLTWRYISGATLEDDSNQPTLGKGTTSPYDHSVPAVQYMDISGTYKVNDKISLRAGVNNLLDQDPPVIANDIVGGANPNTYQVYDLLGRQLFVGLTANF